MRRMALLLVLMIFSLNIFSLDFNYIMNNSNIYKKNVMVFFYQEDDIWQEFSVNFFTGENISKLGEKFNLCFLQSDKYLNLRNFLSVSSGNHIVLLNPYGVEIDRIRLTHNPDDYREFLDFIFRLSKNPMNFLNLRRKAGKYPDNYFFSYELSQKYDKRGMYKNSELSLIDTINSHPTFLDAYISLATLYRKTGNFREAFSILNIASGITKNNDILRMEEIRTYIESGDIQKAFELLKNYNPVEPKLVREKLLAQIICYKLTGQREIAVNLYNELKKLDDLSIYTESARRFLNEE